MNFDEWWESTKDAWDPRAYLSLLEVWRIARKDLIKERATILAERDAARAEVAELLAALKPFAAIRTHDLPDDMLLFDDELDATVGDVRRAVAILAKWTG